MTPEREQAKAEARRRLAAYLDEFPLSYPASLIGKAMYRGHELELNFNETHAVVRKHFRKYGIHHWVWWTKQMGRESWRFAKEKQKEQQRQQKEYEKMEELKRRLAEPQQEKSS
jgi:hypothetical protein